MRRITNRNYRDDGMTVWHMLRVVATNCGDRLIGITSVYSDAMIHDIELDGRKMAAKQLRRARRDLAAMGQGEQRKYGGQNKFPPP